MVGAPGGGGGGGGGGSKYFEKSVDQGKQKRGPGSKFIVTVQRIIGRDYARTILGPCMREYIVTLLIS